MVEYSAGGPASTDENAHELVIPTAWISVFGVDDVAQADDVLGEKVSIAVQDLEGSSHTLEANIVGVTEETITGAGTAPIPSHGLSQQIAEINNSAGGTTVPFTYIQAIVIVDNLAAHEQQIKDDLDAIGMVGQTVE